MGCPLCQHPDCQPFAHADGRDYFRCPRCELTFLHPDQLPTASTERTHYGLHENDPNDPGYRAFLNRLAAPLCEQLTAGSEGLDFGCGPGPALARMLEERGHHMTVYDPLFAPDTSALDRQYDFVTCTEVVEHFHQPAKEFELLAGLVKPGGVLAIMTSLLHDGIDFQKWHYRRDPTHVCFYCQQTFSWLAQHHGLLARKTDHVAIVIMQRCPF
jgi:SAM-dependent methyltransferase